MPKNRPIYEIEGVGVKRVLSDADDLISEERDILGPLYSDVNRLWKILSLWGMLDNKKWRFIWKKVSDGYSSRAVILDRKASLRNRIVLYDIESKDCYRYLVNKNDERLVEALSEAIFFIVNETYNRKESLKKYSAWIEQQEDVFKSLISALQGES